MYVEKGTKRISNVSTLPCGFSSEKGLNYKQSDVGMLGFLVDKTQRIHPWHQQREHCSTFMMRPTASSESSFASSFTRLIFRSFCRLFRLLKKTFIITKTDWGGFHLFTSLTQIQACQWCAEGQGSSSTRSCSSPP